MAKRRATRRLKTKGGRCLVITMKCGKGTMGKGKVRNAPRCVIRVGGRKLKNMTRSQADSKLSTLASQQRSTGCSGPKINLRTLSGYRRRRR